MSEIKRALATIRTIKSVEPIEGADRIVKLTFESMGWVCVTAIDPYPQVGEKRIYFEVDSVLPESNPVFAFMEPYHYRVKTIKLKKQVSQGLSMPMADFADLLNLDVELPLEDGFDLTDILGIVKYEGPADVQISGDTKGPFPGFIEKTDEERAQNFGQNTIEKMLAEHEFDVTIKVDGSSGTFFLINDEFGVCSRNQELKDTEGNIFWKMARKYNLEKRMRKISELVEPHQNFAIQGEVVGPGIQNNRLGLAENKLLVFTIQNVDEAKRLTNDQIELALKQLSDAFTRIDDIGSEDDKCPALEMVPRIKDVPPLKTLADIAALAEGTNLINDKPREGIVLRAKDDPSISCKFINPKYLIKFDL
jgi:RNA ligase (TIGR02306 family)